MTTDESMDAPELIRRVRDALTCREDLIAAYVFGSSVSGRRSELSDVDVAVLTVSPEPSPLAGPAHEHALAAMATAVAKALPDGAGDVDLHEIRSLPLAVQGRILTEGRLVLSRDDAARVRFEVDTRLRYYDFLPFLRTDVREGLRALRAHYGG